MSTGVVITLIICGTIVLINLIDEIGTAVAAKRVHDDIINKFKEEK